MTNFNEWFKEGKFSKFYFITDYEPLPASTEEWYFGWQYSDLNRSKKWSLDANSFRHPNFFETKETNVDLKLNLKQRKYMISSLFEAKF